MAEIVSNSKLEYLAKMFARAHNKVYENYVITAIYSKVNNYDLRPVTQQIVHKKGSKKYYLLDLYFPQINYGVEVNEPAHKRTEYHEHDIQRASDIMNAIDCEEGTIEIDKTYDLESVNKQIDDIVKVIKSKIKTKGPLKWEINEELKNKAFENKIINTKDNIGYKNFSEIWNRITGEDPNKKHRRCYYKNKLLPGGYHLWVPKLTIEMNGRRIGDPKWTNIMNDQRDQIEEYSAKRSKKLKKGPVLDGEKRVVFMRTRNELNSEVVVFVGVFQHEENKDPNTAIYKKVSEEYTW